jgi:hypothetical protein
MACLFLARVAPAHTPGLSTADLAIAAEGRVDARLTFASAEPLHGTPLRDEDLRAFVLKGVDVTADGVVCDATYGGSSVTDQGDLVLDASYACPAGARTIGLVLYYLSALPPGHREVARIVGPEGSNASVAAVLAGDHRALELTLPGAPAPRPGAHERLARRLIVLSAVFAAAMISLFIWRWRATVK